MALIAFPSQIPSTITWSFVPNNRKSNSPWTNTSQNEILDGARFEATVSFRQRNQEEAKALQGFLWACNGSVHEFDLEDPLYAPTGAAPVTFPTIQAGLFTGIDLPTQGWTPSTTVLQQGDYIEVDGNFRGVTADVTSDGAGEATIPLSHRLYLAPQAGSEINYYNPRCRMRLIDNNQANRQNAGGLSSSFSIRCEQVIKYV